MEKREKIYEGKAKILYRTDDPDLLIQYFKDDATAFNAQKRGTIAQKGVINNEISSVIFQWLAAKGVKSHFVKKLSDREMLVRAAKIVPIEVVIRNVMPVTLTSDHRILYGADAAQFLARIRELLETPLALLL